MTGQGTPGGGERRDDGDAALVMAEVRGLCEELAPQRRSGAVHLDDLFDEIGLGSLELNELLLRLERRSGLALPADLLGWAETPRDLAIALGRASPRQRHRPTVPASKPRLSTDDAGPAEGSTLQEVLDWHCTRHPDRSHIRLLDAHDGRPELTYGGLRDAASAVAAGLVDRGVVPGDSVALVLPTGRSYFETFAGVLLAGAVPVPIYPPARRSQLADHLRRQVGILDNSRAVELVTVPEARPLARLLRAQVPSLRSVLVPDEIATSGSRPSIDVAPSDVALLQYTSGSTGDPKGVVLTHANLLANIRAMAHSARVRPSDVFVSWLPLYHDMGLIGAWLGSLTVGMRLAVMSPTQFLREPSRWLWAIHEEGGTISAGPNFAYALCATRIDDADIAGLDLSGWRLAFNGAEPVSAATLERFTTRFEPYGFRGEALMPVYGLAEASVGLTFPPPGRWPLVDSIRRERFLRDGVAQPVGGTAAGALRFAACGRPLPGHEIRIVDPTGGELPERREGRIHMRGPSATSGYLRNASATRALFRGDWLDTGDLGYVADGDLYVTGRVKDMIVRAGRNIHPEELEEAVGVLPDVRAGCVVAFGSQEPGGDGERLVVVAETRLVDSSARAALRAAVVATCVDLVDVAPDEVVLASPGTVPKTSSGKIRRAAARELYRNETLQASRPRQRVQLARFGGRAAFAQLHALGRRVLDGLWALWAWSTFVGAGAVVLVALALTPRQRLRRRIAQRVLRGVALAVGVPVVVRHPDRIVPEASVIVANHPSWIDALVLAGVLPPDVTFVAGEVLAGQRVAGFALRRIGVRFVERSDREHGLTDTETLVAAARAGETLVMFPEGRLDARPGLRPFHLGAFAVAAEAQRAVTPVVLSGTRAILAPGRRRPHRGVATVTICEPLRPTGSDWAAMLALRDDVHAVIAARCAEPDLGR